ncbi:CbrC family protein [Streptomyces sp. NBC_01750]|uniref:CbrC family protein n=1 Tax=Streptomyces sp. NBC_01750 TaxID=2975928 RepID=UPI002DDB8C91|nr:CbrC family protein [Streptomyces sp. NBC_01750]WSD30648.1 CbrC family protein [Streptomyces sp. NBC_01750]
MSASLPFFRYHPDPLASGSIRASTEVCACCNRSTGWIYTATFYTAQATNGTLLPLAHRRRQRRRTLRRRIHGQLRA